MNPNITMKDIIDNPDKDWDWTNISENPNITMKDIIDNPDNIGIGMRFLKIKI